MRVLWKFQLSLVCLCICLGCADSKKSFPGYVEGFYTYISSAASGTLFHWYVQNGQWVKKGDLLYTLDQDPEKSNVEVIKANMRQLKAEIDFAKIQLARQQALFLKNAAAKESVDQARTDFISKSQHYSALEAELVKTQWSLKQKTQYAPVSGYVFDTFYRIGERIPENRPALAILAPENIHLLFYIPEEVLYHIKLGQAISFTCDSCNKRTKAIINYISSQAEYTPPVIYSKDTRYKLVYLIRAIIPDPAITLRFHPGQPIDVYLQP